MGSNVDVIRSAEGAAPASRNDPQRDVFIACSPMDINKHIFGRLTDVVAKLVTWFGGVPRPNVLFHWGVIVGDYVHELNYDAHYYNMYENKQAEVVNPESKLHRGAYRLYKVGTTRFNDAAIVEEGVKAIAEPYMTPVYHVRTNNCHKFVIELLNLICDANRKRVMTTFGFLCSGEMVGGESDMETMLNTVQYLMDQSEAEKKSMLCCCLSNDFKLTIIRSPRTSSSDRH